MLSKCYWNTYNEPYIKNESKLSECKKIRLNYNPWMVRRRCGDKAESVELRRQCGMRGGRKEDEEKPRCRREVVVPSRGTGLSGTRRAEEEKGGEEVEVPLTRAMVGTVRCCRSPRHQPASRRLRAVSSTQDLSSLTRAWSTAPSWHSGVYGPSVTRTNALSVIVFSSIVIV